MKTALGARLMSKEGTGVSEAYGRARAARRALLPAAAAVAAPPREDEAAGDMTRQ